MTEMSERDGVPPPAWLPVPGDDDLPPEVEETIRPISDKLGFVPTPRPDASALRRLVES